MAGYIDVMLMFWMDLSRSSSDFSSFFQKNSDFVSTDFVEF